MTAKPTIRSTVYWDPDTHAAIEKRAGAEGLSVPLWIKRRILAIVKEK